MTRRECVIFVLIGIAMIAASLTMLFGPWGLFGTGAALLIGVPLLVDQVDEVTERKEVKPNG